MFRIACIYRVAQKFGTFCALYYYVKFDQFSKKFSKAESG